MHRDVNEPVYEDCSHVIRYLLRTADPGIKAHFRFPLNELCCKDFVRCLYRGDGTVTEERVGEGLLDGIPFCWV